jgi:hypothetical protein
MPFDLGSDMFEYFISLVQLILVYISKIAIWVGLLIIANQSIRGLFYKRIKANLSMILKGVAIFVVSASFYFVLA